MKNRSLIVITVDCLRADHVGFMGYSRPVTPFLDSLAKESVTFSDAIVAFAPTYFSFPAIMASRYPLSLGRNVVGIAPNEPTIATALQDKGCATAAFLAGNPYLSARFGYHEGFDVFRDFLNWEPVGDALHLRNDGWLTRFNRRLRAASGRTRPTATAYDELYFWYRQWRQAQENLSVEDLRYYPSADVVVDQACSWLSSLGDQRFFLWLHLMDPHHPYYPPRDALDALGNSTTDRRARFLNSFWGRPDIGTRRLERYREEILALYDGGVYWVDNEISRLARAVKQMQRWHDTVIVVTADHGEQFLEQNIRFHAPMGLPEQLIHVPLLVRAAGLERMHLSQGPFSLIHLAPTLLEALDVAVPTSFQGRSYWREILRGNLPNDPAIAECIEACDNPVRMDQRMRPRVMAVRDREYKLVIHFSESTERIYNLKEDPQERTPLPNNAVTAERIRLLRAASTHLQKTLDNRDADITLRAHIRDMQYAVGNHEAKEHF